MNVSEAFTEAQRLSRLIDAAIEGMKNTTVEFAKAEQDYRHAKAAAWVQVRDVLEKGTVPEREAWVGGETSDQRYRRDLADGMRQAALEAVRSRRGQLSALQTFLNAEKAEMGFARTGPN